MLNKNKECMYYVEYHSLVYHSSILDTIFTMIVPTVLIIVFNIFIIIKVWRSLRTKWRSSEVTETTCTTAVDDQISRDSPDRKGHSGATSGSGEENPQERIALQPIVCKQDETPSPQGHQVLLRRQTSLESPNRSELCCRFIRSKLSCFSYSRATESRVITRASSINTTSRASQNINSQRSQTTQLRTTRTLLIISSLFVVFNLPSHTFRVWVTLYPPSGIPSEQLLLGQLVFQFLYYINFSSNLFMYCACSQLFRKELKTLLQRLGYKISACWGNMIDCIKS